MTAFDSGNHTDLISGLFNVLEFLVDFSDLEKQLNKVPDTKKQKNDRKCRV